MKTIIGPLEALRRLSRGELGRREKTVDAIQDLVHRWKTAIRSGFKIPKTKLSSTNLPIHRDNL